MVLAVVALIAAATAGCGSAERRDTASEALQTPDVRHEQPAQARRELVQLGAVARFAFLGAGDEPCAGLPPAGVIVRQQPNADAAIEPHEIVRLQTSCGPSSTDDRCSARDLRLKALANNGLNGAQDYVGFTLFHFRGPPCEFDRTVTAEIQSRPSGAPLPGVAGSPDANRIHERLGAGESLTQSWAWVNWCAQAQPAQVAIEVSGLRATDGAPTPACWGVGGRSELRYDADASQSYVSAPRYRSALQRSRPSWVDHPDTAHAAE